MGSCKETNLRLLWSALKEQKLIRLICSISFVNQLMQHFLWHLWQHCYKSQIFVKMVKTLWINHGLRYEVTEALINLHQRHDNETPEMWCSQIRIPFKKVLKEN